MASAGWPTEFGGLIFSIGKLRTTFPARLRAWRQRENLSQSEAALRWQISKRTLQEWEHGRAAPHALARAAVENAVRP